MNVFKLKNTKRCFKFVRFSYFSNEIHLQVDWWLLTQLVIVTELQFVEHLAIETAIGATVKFANKRHWQQKVIINYMIVEMKHRSPLELLTKLVWSWSPVDSTIGCVVVGEAGAWNSGFRSDWGLSFDCFCMSTNGGGTNGICSCCWF